MSQIISVEQEHINFYDISYDTPGNYFNIRKNIFKNISYLLPIIKSVRTLNASKISTTDYYSQRTQLSKSQVKNHLYPIAVRYITKDNQFVIERPPFELEIDFRLGSAGSHAKKISSTKIWIPWTVMIVKLNSLTAADFSSVKLFFNDGPINSLEDALLPPWLPNSYSAGNICFSNSLSDFNNVLDIDQILDGDLAYIYNYIFNNYMMGGWNTDLHPHFNYLYVDQISSYESKYPNLYRYNYPSKDQIKTIVSNYSDENEAKYIKKCLSSKQTVFRSRNVVNAYVRHLTTLSSLSLEETLSLITETKSSKHNYITKFKLSNILNYDATNRYSENNFITKFNTTVISNPIFNAQYDYKVTDNFVYFETETYTETIRRALNNPEINRDYYSFSDSLFQYIGPKNVAALEQYLITLNKNNIFGKIVICSFAEDGSFQITLAPENVTVSSLVEEHRQRLQSLIQAATDFSPQMKAYLADNYSDLSKEEFKNAQ